MKNLILLSIAILTSLISTAQKEAVEKVWFNPEKTSKIQIYKAVNGNFYGRVIWLKEPNDKNGKPKTDIRNKDEKLRNQPILGMLIIKKFKKASSANEYEDGTVYDPLSGKTYCGTMSLNGKELKLRGFICGINFVGRTSIWTLAE
jgi:uncharacterized protein (DUF2147 family)